MISGWLIGLMMSGTADPPAASRMQPWCFGETRLQRRIPISTARVFLVSAQHFTSAMGQVVREPYVSIGREEARSLVGAAQADQLPLGGSFTLFRGGFWTPPGLEDRRSIERIAATDVEFEVTWAPESSETMVSIVQGVGYAEVRPVDAVFVLASPEPVERLVTTCTAYR